MRVDELAQSIAIFPPRVDARSAAHFRDSSNRGLSFLRKRQLFVFSCFDSSPAEELEVAKGLKF